jgi:hypothetical protein
VCTLSLSNMTFNPHSLSVGPARFIEQRAIVSSSITARSHFVIDMPVFCAVRSNFIISFTCGYFYTRLMFTVYGLCDEWNIIFDIQA